jgi:hypothetical protein
MYRPGLSFTLSGEYSLCLKVNWFGATINSVHRGEMYWNCSCGQPTRVDHPVPLTMGGRRRHHQHPLPLYTSNTAWYSIITNLQSSLRSINFFKKWRTLVSECLHIPSPEATPSLPELLPSAPRRNDRSGCEYSEKGAILGLTVLWQWMLEKHSGANVSWH